MVGKATFSENTNGVVVGTMVVVWCAIVPPVLFAKNLFSMGTLCCSNNGSDCCGSASGATPKL